MNPVSSLLQRRFGVSLQSLLFGVVILGLVLSNILTIRQRDQLQRELAASRPLPMADVARQFKEQTTLGPIAVVVRDVRYSSAADSYKVDYSWTDATTGQTWSSDVVLKSDGYGTYVGQIHNSQFVQALGYNEAFTVAVKTPMWSHS